MANARAMVFLKLVLDLFAAILTLVIYFVYVFEYMKDFRIFPTQLEIYTSSGDMDTSIVGPFGTICDKYCTDSTWACHEVCKRDNDFKTAGILFITFSSISLLFTVYSACNLIGMACGCTCFGLFRFKWFHFGIPLSNALALVLYVCVSRVFSLSSGVYGNSYEMKAGPGLVLMFIVLALDLSSAAFFLYALKNGIEDILLVTQTGYRAASESMEKPPSRPVSKSRNSTSGKN